MNLFLRLVLVWIKHFFKKRIGPWDAFETHYTVWLTDQDMLRHMTNSRFFSLTDVCVIDFFLRARVFRVFRKIKCFPLIVYEDMQFLKPLRYPQKFRVRTHFMGADLERVICKHTFLRDDTTVAVGWTIARFVDRKGKPVPVVRVLDGLKTRSPELPQEAIAVLDRMDRSGASRSLAAT